MSGKVKAVYTIVEGEHLQKPLFVRIGVAFVNRDDSLNLRLDALPVSGRLHVRDAEPKEDTDATTEARLAEVA